MVFMTQPRFAFQTGFILLKAVALMLSFGFSLDVLAECRGMALPDQIALIAKSLTTKYEVKDSLHQEDFGIITKTWFAKEGVVFTWYDPSGEVVASANRSRLNSLKEINYFDCKGTLIGTSSLVDKNNTYQYGLKDKQGATIATASMIGASEAIAFAFRDLDGRVIGLVEPPYYLTWKSLEFIVDWGFNSLSQASIDIRMLILLLAHH